MVVVLNCNLDEVEATSQTVGSAPVSPSAQETFLPRGRMSLFPAPIEPFSSTACSSLLRQSNARICENVSRACIVPSLGVHVGRDRRIGRFGSMGRTFEWHRAPDSGAASAYPTGPYPGPATSSREPSSCDHRAASLDSSRAEVGRNPALRFAALTGLNTPTRPSRNEVAELDLENGGRRHSGRSSESVPNSASSGGNWGSGFFSRLLRGLGGGSEIESGAAVLRSDNASRRRGSCGGGHGGYAGDASNGLAGTNDPFPCQRSYILSPSRHAHIMRTSTV